MKRYFCLLVVLFAVSSFADTINNFNGFNDGWAPFGDPLIDATQTYGEIFTAPQGVNTLESFSFYTGNPYSSGNIITGGYVATWTGTHAGSLVYDGGGLNYDNLGNEQLTFNTNGAAFVTPGKQYVVFLSTSKFHGQSFGSTYLSAGASDPNLNGFAYFNNGASFDTLFFNDWEGIGLSPDIAVDLQFDTTPEPASLVLLGTGLLASMGALRRKITP